MPQPSQSVKKFVSDAYKLVSSSGSTVPLHGSDLSDGIQYLNELLQHYSATGLLLTVDRTTSKVITTGEGTLTIGAADYTPTPDIIEGRLSMLSNAWVELEGVTYPLRSITPSEFDSSYKYLPLEGLPTYIIVDQGTNVTNIRIFPAPSQEFTLYIRGKFQVAVFISTDTMESLPEYYMRYLKFALASDLADYKGRSEAWTPKLEEKLKETRSDMYAASDYSLDVSTGDDGLMPNGAFRVISGI